MSCVTQIPLSDLTSFLWALERWRYFDCWLAKTVLSNIAVNDVKPLDHCQILQTLENTLIYNEHNFNTLAKYILAGKKGSVEDCWFMNIV